MIMINNYGNNGYLAIILRECIFFSQT